MTIRLVQSLEEIGLALDMPGTPEAAVSIRVVSLDWSLVPPVHGLDLTHSPFSFPPQPLKRVSVLRIFGTTKSGQKAVAHVHQVLPYFYVGYDGPVDSRTVHRRIYQLGRSLNKALAISFKAPEHLQDKSTHVAAIALVKGVPFYGFHIEYAYFFKIYLIDPGHVTRAVDLLSKGVVLGRRLQTYESHIPYIPQFLIDHNLLGMDYMDLAGCLFRGPMQDLGREANNPNIHYYTPVTTAPHLISTLQRESFCELEFDTVAGDILNRARIAERPFKPLIDLTNGTQRIDTKLVPSLRSLWEDEHARRVKRGMQQIAPTPPPDPAHPSTNTKAALMNTLLEKIDNWKRTSRHDPAAGAAAASAGEVAQSVGPAPPFYDFPGFSSQDGVPTVFNAISALYFGGEVMSRQHQQQQVQNTEQIGSAVETESDIGILSQLSQSFSDFREEDAQDQHIIIDEKILSQVRKSFFTIHCDKRFVDHPRT
ncbi:ribonuclease H-like domain-containing protein [Chytriomyces sp. MP71]|nr:ribonuclease H-like domain-containing protein [Chytriomyces sp. MP71]